MKIRLAIISVLLLMAAVSCTRNEKVRLKASFVELSTDVGITLFDICSSDTARASSALRMSREIFSGFDSQMNPYDPISDLSRMNGLPAKIKHEIPSSLREILKISANICKYTDGYFDVAIHPVIELWGFHTGSEPAVPDKDSLAAALKFSVLDSYILEKDSFLVKDGRCRINLGGVAKGYAVDSVASYLVSQGFNDFIVEAGGDMAVRSAAERKIGVRHPRIANALIDTLYISSGCIATSGDYEKYIESEGVRYCHIINPFTGYGTSDIVSVTVISDKTYQSDAFATAAFAMGMEKARYLIEKNGFSGIIFYYGPEGDLERADINMDAYKHGGEGDFEG